MAAHDPYSTGRPALMKTAFAVVLFSTITWALAEIVGASGLVVAVILILSGLILVGCLIWTYRRWQMRTEKPALLRKNLASVLRTELPPGSLTVSGHSFGKLLKPGPPKRIRINQPGLPPIEGEVTQRIQHIAGEICQNQYVVDQKKSTPGKRIVMRQKPRDKSVHLTPKQEVEQGILKAVAAIFPKSNPKVAYQWDDEAEDPYLLSVTITEVDGMDLALSGKRRQILTKLRTR